MRGSRGATVSRAPSSVCGKKTGVESLVDLLHLLAAEGIASGHLGHRGEVAVLSARQTPVEHARGGVADVLEPVHRVAGNEDDGAGAGGRGPAPDGQLVGALDDEEHLLLIEMKVIGRAFTGLVPSDD